MSAERMQILLDGLRDMAAKAQRAPVTMETLAAGMALAELFDDFDALMCGGRGIPTDWKK
ncbi:hypothetical protein SEA_ENYGMA_289 [Streptomyces phage Enygma]